MYLQLTNTILPIALKKIKKKKKKKKKGNNNNIFNPFSIKKNVSIFNFQVLPYEKYLGYQWYQIQLLQKVNLTYASSKMRFTFYYSQFIYLSHAQEKCLNTPSVLNKINYKNYLELWYL